MRTLTEMEIQEVSGAKKFKIHFNIFEAVAGIMAGAILGPAGIGYAIGTIIITQALGQLHDMGVEELGMSPLQ